RSLAFGRHPDGSTQRSERRAHPLQLRTAVEVLAAVMIALARDQDLGRNLREAVEDALDAKLRRAARPDGAQTRGREKGDQRLGCIGDVTDDAITALDTEPA